MNGKRLPRRGGRAHQSSERGYGVIVLRVRSELTWDSKREGLLIRKYESERGSTDPQFYVFRIKGVYCTLRMLYGRQS